MSGIIISFTKPPIILPITISIESKPQYTIDILRVSYKYCISLYVSLRPITGPSKSRPDPSISRPVTGPSISRPG